MNFCNRLILPFLIVSAVLLCVPGNSSALHRSRLSHASQQKVLFSQDVPSNPLYTFTFQMLPKGPNIISKLDNDESNEEKIASVNVDGQNASEKMKQQVDPSAYLCVARMKHRYCESKLFPNAAAWFKIEKADVRVSGIRFVVL